MSIKPDLPVFCLFKKGQTVRHIQSGDLYFIKGVPLASVMKVGDEWRPAYFYSPSSVTTDLFCAREQHDFEAKFKAVRDVVTDPRVGDVITHAVPKQISRIVTAVEDSIVAAEGSGDTFKKKKVTYRVIGESGEYFAWGHVWFGLCKDSVVTELAE